jgi:hypothetical protein
MNGNKPFGELLSMSTIIPGFQIVEGIKSLSNGQATKEWGLMSIQPVLSKNQHLFIPGLAAASAEENISLAKGKFAVHRKVGDKYIQDVYKPIQLES